MSEEKECIKCGISLLEDEENLCELCDVKQQLQACKEELQAYKEDRFCQGGCAIYQYDKMKELKEENEKLKEQHKWDKKREQLNGDIMWGKDKHNTKCLDKLFGTLMERNTTIATLTQQNKQMRDIFEILLHKSKQQQNDGTSTGYAFAKIVELFSNQALKQ